MSKGQQPREGKARRDSVPLDPVLTELVKLLARSAAERDYPRLCRDGAEPKAVPPQGKKGSP
jgi:hypothetical protein